MSDAHVKITKLLVRRALAQLVDKDIVDEETKKQISDTLNLVEKTLEDGFPNVATTEDKITIEKLMQEGSIQATGKHLDVPHFDIPHADKPFPHSDLPHIDFPKPKY